jgi:hypothetical protein
VGKQQPFLGVFHVTPSVFGDWWLVCTLRAAIVRCKHRGVFTVNSCPYVEDILCVCVCGVCVCVCVWCVFVCEREREECQSVCVRVCVCACV